MARDGGFSQLSHFLLEESPLGSLTYSLPRASLCCWTTLLTLFPHPAPITFPRNTRKLAHPTPDCQNLPECASKCESPLQEFLPALGSHL